VFATPGAGPLLAATTPLPVNSPGFDVAAIAGVPWFTEARSALLVLAAVWCCVCAAVAGVCASLAAACSCGVGCADVPPVPPLKLTFVTFVLVATVLL
jgi:hypothetical protein